MCVVYNRYDPGAKYEPDWTKGRGDIMLDRQTEHYRVPAEWCS